LIAGHKKLPDLLTSEKRSGGGNALLRTIIFILLIAVLLIVVFGYRSDETKIKNKIEKLKIGMTGDQVNAILGSPKRIEKLPFSKDG
jgi:outer membrane protein assembly factor BamE (lipoprotein component of BamABCDE complex)